MFNRLKNNFSSFFKSTPRPCGDYFPKSLEYVQQLLVEVGEYTHASKDPLFCPRRQTLRYEHDSYKEKDFYPLDLMMVHLCLSFNLKNELKESETYKHFSESFKYYSSWFKQDKVTGEYLLKDQSTEKWQYLELNFRTKGYRDWHEWCEAYHRLMYNIFSLIRLGLDTPENRKYVLSHSGQYLLPGNEIYKTLLKKSTSIQDEAKGSAVLKVGL